MLEGQDRLDKIGELSREQAEIFQERNPKSLEWCRRAVNASMPMGVATNVSTLYPYPLFIEHGEGAYLYDVDGHKLLDYGGGFGAMPFSFSHPKVVEALVEQAKLGTHYGTSTTAVVLWAEHVCSRFGLDWVRFSASGTEATMDAIRLARAYTKRIKVGKVEGAYHGSHVDALVSINQPLGDDAGTDTHPASRPGDESIPMTAVEQIVVIPYNNLEVAEEMLRKEDLACLLIEPILFNVGHISPEGDYLAELRRLCDETGTLLIFDEVKTAATVAWGGAEELYGVKPHIKCFAKTVCGGLAGGAFGDTDGKTFSLIEEFKMMHVGTLSGNPLTAAAGYAALHDVLVPEAYDGFNQHGLELAEGLQEVIEEYDLKAYVTHLGAKGCIVWSDHRLKDFRDYIRNFDGEIAFLAWLYFLNKGLFLAPGHDEQFTFGVAHGGLEAHFFIEVFRDFVEFAREAGVL
jgi:glutamate-1-semialdehyde 2,1-aminomutase